MFPTGTPADEQKAHQNGDASPPGIEDLRKYERDAEPDDYPRRMLVNFAAFAFIVALAIAGMWIVDQMALLRKQQDCATFGRVHCADIDPVVRTAR